jgi:hypothetical protein
METKMHELKNIQLSKERKKNRIWLGSVGGTGNYLNW